jgi:hypothetical protein
VTPLEVGLSQARPGLALEFGVAEGGTLRVLASARPSQTYGFDSFDGLPEHWREGFTRGRFACSPPDVPGAELVVGLFEDTLPAWLARHHVADIGLVHIDCDLYSSTATVLDHMHHLESGTVIVFDELTGYPGWEQHEHRALLEWVASSGIILEPIASEGEAAAFKVT